MDYAHSSDSFFMMLRVLLTTSLLLTAACAELHSTEVTEGLSFEINFDGKSPAFITARELEIWGGSRGLTLVPDNPLRSLEDGIAAVIPPHGAQFSLKTPARLSYLYLDLVRFFPGPETEAGVRWLDVTIGDQQVETIYAGGQIRRKHIEIIPIYPEQAPSGIARVGLRPGAGEAFFAIWDAFVSKYRLKLD